MVMWKELGESEEELGWIEMVLLLRYQEAQRVGWG